MFIAAPFIIAVRTAPEQKIDPACWSIIDAGGRFATNSKDGVGQNRAVISLEDSSVTVYGKCVVILDTLLPDLGISGLRDYVSALSESPI